MSLFSYSFFTYRSLEDFAPHYLSEFSTVAHDDELLVSIVSNITPHIPEIDRYIEEAAPEWPFDQISRIDVAILRLAVYEMVIARSVPHKVAIDEAVELAKEFSTETAPKFVNGVLGSIVKKFFLESAQ